MKNKMRKLVISLGLSASLFMTGNCFAASVDEFSVVFNESGDLNESIFDGYTKLEVDGGDISGNREENAVVDIGYGDREYWEFTNEYGQLVRVVAEDVILQDDSKEDVTSEGRYYADEAKVPGVESKDLDEGHIIADSLGGVSNAYNITPQDSTLNRHGDQAYMEDAIRDAGGCSEFVAVITYPNTSTQIPSHYSYSYVINGEEINDEFDNGNPDEYNEKAGLYENTSKSEDSSKQNQVVSNVPENGEMVWVTVTGSKYHKTNSCGSINPDNCSQITKEEAEGKGLEACKKCY